ncbi:MAG: 30S ribosomal protein S3 [Candidatus Hydrogenedentes bacterium]|nr:30S ribosomal protein S3 [Candidatus Hydrogenedentota bacterium]MBI3118041.1 30S ribosomal protein S3 [Candidatus Hydrogenedentota bacterium]
MGQKVHPNGFRLGVIQTWSSIWYAGDKNYAALLHEDLKLRDYIKKRLYQTGVAKVDIERAGRKTKVHIYTARPGLVIGQRGAEVDKLRYELERLTGHELLINIHEVLSPELSSTLVAESIAQQLARRVSFRRAVKKSIQNTMRLGAKGIRVRVAGRLGGAEIARSESARQGSVPLHTLRANVDYGVATSHTTYGCIGVKIWIYHGDVLPGEQVAPVGGERPQHGTRSERSSEFFERPERGERQDRQQSRSGR